MCKKNKSHCGVGLVLLGCGVALGAYLAKKHYEKRKQLLKNYNVEVDRLQNEVDFDYSEEFLKELKKETLRADKKHYSKDDVMKAVHDSKEAVNEQIRKLEVVIKEHLKKEEALEEQEAAPADEKPVIEVEIEVDESDFDLDAEAKLDNSEDE